MFIKWLPFLLLCCVWLPDVMHAQTKMDFNYYHRSDELLTAVHTIALGNPAHMKYHVRSMHMNAAGTGELVEIPFVTVSTEQVPQMKQPKLKVLIVCGEHGREPITGEVALRLLRYLDLADAGGARLNDAPEHGLVRWLLARVEFTVVPLLSRWSREQVERGRVCNRKNENEVDPNRNWDYEWNKGVKGTPPTRSEIYPGPAPFSEPQSRMLRDLATSLRPDVYVNVHSGASELYYGWDHRKELVPNHAHLQRLLDYLRTRHCQNCVSGGAGDVGGYFVFGGSMDYIYDVLRCKTSLTFEVYGGERRSMRDCFPVFNPHTEQLYEATVTNWAKSLLQTAVWELEHSRGQWYALSKVSLVPDQLAVQRKNGNPRIPNVATYELQKTATRLELAGPAYRVLQWPSGIKGFEEIEVPLENDESCVSDGFTSLPLYVSGGGESPVVLVIGGVDNMRDFLGPWLLRELMHSAAGHTDDVRIAVLPSAHHHTHAALLEMELACEQERVGKQALLQSQNLGCSLKRLVKNLGVHAVVTLRTGPGAPAGEDDGAWWSGDSPPSVSDITSHFSDTLGRISADVPVLSLFVDPSLFAKRLDEGEFEDSFDENQCCVMDCFVAPGRVAELAAPVSEALGRILSALGQIAVPAVLLPDPLKPGGQSSASSDSFAFSSSSSFSGVDVEQQQVSVTPLLAAVAFAGLIVVLCLYTFVKNWLSPRHKRHVGKSTAPTEPLQLQTEEQRKRTIRLKRPTRRK